MICKSCGSELPPESCFCCNCGSAVTDNNETEIRTSEQVQIAPDIAPEVDVTDNVSVNTEQPAPATETEETQNVEKEPFSIFSKSFLIKALFGVMLTALYAAVSVLFALVVDLKGTVTVTTLFDNDVTFELTLKEFLQILSDGNRLFYPTPITNAISVGIYVLIYSVPVFAVMAFLGMFANKRTVALHVVFSIVSLLSAAATAVIVPISAIVIPELKEATAASVGAIIGDIDKFSAMPLMIFSCIVLALIIVSIVIEVLFVKRRSSK